MSEDITIWQQGIVKGFSLKPYDEKLYGNILGYFEGEMVEFCIRKKKKKPSKETHSYYRGVIIPVCMQSEKFRGWKKDEIHKYFVSQHLKDVVEKEINGHHVFIVTTMSTSDVSQRTMNKFIEDVRNELAQEGIVTPDPVKQ